MARGTRLLRLAAVAATAAVVLAGCGGGDIKNSDSSAAGGKDCGDLNIAVNPWTGYVANAHVVGVVAEKKLGCKVNYQDVKEEVGWQGMANGSIDTIVENWGHADLVKKYIDQQKTVEDAGLTGSEGLIGWYVPPWMTQKYPDITDWKNLNKYASMFKTSESGGKGQLLDGDPSYVTNDEALVKNLHLNYKVVVGGSEAALLIQLPQRGEEQDAAAGLLLHAAVVRRCPGPDAHTRCQGPGQAGARQAAGVQARVRRQPGQGRLRLPAVPPEQADLEEVRGLRLAGGEADQELQVDQRRPEPGLQVHRRGQDGPGRRG